MAARILYNGWSEPALREALGLTPAGAQDVLRYIASHPRCTSAEIADDLGLKSARSVGPTLTGFTRASEHLQIKDTDGQFHWPLDFPGKRGTYWLYDMPASVRAVVLDVLGDS